MPVLHAGTTTVGEMRSEKAASLQTFFEKEERAINGCNPTLMMFILKKLMRDKNNE